MTKATAGAAEPKVLTVASAQRWDDWLEQHHDRTPEGVWLRLFKKASKRKSPTWSEAVDVALCFGWIDGQAKSYDDESRVQRFTPRRARSVWSKLNTERVERLVESGRMRPAGLAEVDAAKRDGRWARAYDPPSTATVPADFLAELAQHKKAEAFFRTLTKRNTYPIAYRLQNAKTPETRTKRINAIIAMFERGEKPRLTEVRARYARIAAGFGARVRGIGADAWPRPTPCAEWTVRDVVAHVVAVHRHVVAGLDASTPPPPATDTDLHAAWNAATAEVLAALADPERASAPVTGRFAPMPLEEMIGRLLCSDTLVHTWDVARATGQGEQLDPAGVTYAYAMLLPNDEAIRGPGSFGPKIEPPPGADEQTRFLCFLGRRVERERDNN